jgi:hypothetical protein
VAHLVLGGAQLVADLQELGALQRQFAAARQVRTAGAAAGQQACRGERDDGEGGPQR